jgi:hypothetical protein
MADQSPYGDYTLLFNLKDDENETTNLAGQNAPKVEELRALIKDWEKDKKPAAWPTARDVTWNVCGGFHRADLMARRRWARQPPRTGAGSRN